MTAPRSLAGILCKGTPGSRGLLEARETSMNRRIMTMRVLIPLADDGFDPTEVAIPWRVLSDAGHVVSFATPSGSPGRADPVMVSGEGLDPWGFLPVVRRIRLLGLALRADAGARQAYRQLERDARFSAPLAYEGLDVADFDGLLLPGGHAKPVREYLESERLQAFVAEFF